MIHDLLWNKGGHCKPGTDKGREWLRRQWQTMEDGSVNFDERYMHYVIRAAREDGLSNASENSSST